MATNFTGSKEDLRGQLMLKQAEDDVARSANWSEVIKYVFFLVILSLVVLNQVHIEEMFTIGSAISQELSNGEYLSFEDIYTAEDIKQWLVTEFLQVVVKGSTENNLNGVYDKRTITNFNRIMSPVRLLQKRMKLKDNPSTDFIGFVDKVWVGTGLNLYSSSSDEDKSPYGPWDVFSYDPNSGANNEGGFTQIIYLDNLGNATNDLTFLMQNDWIDRQTACMFVDFSLYNGHLNVMTYVSVQFIFMRSGYVKKYAEVIPLRLELYLTPNDYLRLIGEIIYLLMTVLYTAIELYQLKLILAAKTLEFMAKNEAVHKKSFHLLKEAVKTYFASGWNYLDIASIIFSYIAIILWIQYIANPIVVPGDTPVDWNLTNSLLSLELTYTRYVSINAFNFFLVFLRLMKYFGVLERVRLLQQSLSRAGLQVIYFLALVCAVFLAFVIYGHVAFGSDSIHFNSFAQSLIECLLILFGDFNGLWALRTQQPVLFVLFFIPYTVLMLLILSNMFIAIISGAYRVSLDKLEDIKKKQEDFPDHILFRAMRWVQALLKRIRLMFKRGEKAIEKYVEHERQLRMEERYSEGTGDFNENYLNYIKVSDRIDRDLATGREIDAKVQRIRKKKEMDIIRALRFMLFVGLFLGVVLWQQNLTLSYALQATVSENINLVTEGNNKTFVDIYDYYRFYDWADGLIDAFVINPKDNHVYLGNRLYLFGQETNRTSFRFSIRTLNLSPNDSKRYSMYEPLVRDPTGFTPDASSPSIENTTTLLFNSTNSYQVLTYQHSKGYSNAGAYILYFSANQFAYAQEFSEFKGMSILGIRTNSLVIDFVLYNSDVNYFVYTALALQFQSGGRINKEMVIMPLQFQHYKTPEDMARAAFELLFFLLLIVISVSRGVILKKKWRNYGIWVNKKYESLTKEQIYRRNRVKPELIRRLESLLTLFVVVELLAYLLAFVCVGLWLSIIAIDDSSTAIDPGNTAFFDVFSTYTNLRKAYLIIVSITSLLFCIRLMKYLQLNQSLGVLHDTLSLAARDIGYFLMLFFVLLLGFVFMAYLCFGATLEHYSSVGNAFIYCFQSVTHSFNFEEINKVNSTMAPIYFFFLSILYTFVMLNFFIAILARAYASVKEHDVSDKELTASIFQAVFSYCMKLCRRRQRKMEKPKEPVVKIRDFGFARMNSGLEPAENEESWANRYSEQMMLEQNKRKQVLHILEEAGRRRRDHSLRHPSIIDENMDNDELEARKQYWEYLREGYLHFHAQEAKIFHDMDRSRRLQQSQEQDSEDVAKRNVSLGEEIKSLEMGLEDATERLKLMEEMIDQKKMSLKKKKEGKRT